MDQDRAPGRLGYPGLNVHTQGARLTCKCGRTWSSIRRDSFLQALKSDRRSSARQRNFAFFLVTYLTGRTIFWINYRLVVVTDDAIYGLDSTKPSWGAEPKSLLGTLPRHIQLGPVSGRWANSTSSASATGSTGDSTPNRHRRPRGRFQILRTPTPDRQAANPTTYPASSLPAAQAGHGVQNGVGEHARRAAGARRNTVIERPWGQPSGLRATLAARSGSAPEY